ncbi:hypothetical protein RUM43_001186 [Polyplax serrata]|uniref:Uncharacterized protein n=1 Tax=Polyplax serrata TaxID=468196 RepID=A0AAN8SDL6_POLSC
MSKKTSRLESESNDRLCVKTMEEDEDEGKKTMMKESRENGELTGNEDEKTRESDSETEKVAETEERKSNSKEKRFDRCKLNVLNFRLEDKSVGRGESPSPDEKDDGSSEHSESSKLAEEKEASLRIPLSEPPLGSGPGRGAFFGASAARNPHFPPPVFMWCPTIGLPPWCPALFPTGFVFT